MSRSLSFSNILPPFSHAPARPRYRQHDAPAPAWRVYAAYTLLLALGGTLVWYLLGVNAYAAKGYELRELERRLKTLQEEQRTLNLQVSEQTSIASVGSAFETGAYVPVGEAKYLEHSQFSKR